MEKQFGFKRSLAVFLAVLLALPWHGQIAEAAQSLPEGYTTDGSGIMASKIMSDQTIDIMANYGGEWIQTTFSRDGYAVQTSELGGAAVTSSTESVNGGQYMKLMFTVSAGDAGVTDGKLAVHADVQIGDNDYATVNVIKNSAGEVIGLSMVDEHSADRGCISSNAQFNMYFGGTGGATGVDTYWFGYYSDRRGNCYTQINRDSASSSSSYSFDESGNVEAYQGSDSGIAFSWQHINLQPGQNVTYSVLVGVGEKSAPPKWSNSPTDNSPLNLTQPQSPDAPPTEADKLTIQVQTAVTDAAGITDTVYCSVNNGQEVPVCSGTATGSRDVFTGNINLQQLVVGEGQPLPDGIYIINFWIVNSKGAASESIQRAVTVTDGVITAGLDQPWNPGDWEQPTPEPTTSIRVDNQISGQNITVNGLEAVAAAGGDTDVVDVVFRIGRQTQEAEGAAQIKTAAGERSLEYFDFTLTLSRNGIPQENIGDTNTSLLAIIMPFDLSGKSDLAVYRYHGGQAESLTADPGAVGERFEIRQDSIVIYAMKFSTYAVAYRTGENSTGAEDNNHAGGVNPDVGTDNHNPGNDAGDKAPSGGNDREPKTGDASFVWHYATLAMIAGFSYLLLLFSERHGLTVEHKNALMARLIAWAKKGGKFRRLIALAAITLLCVYYHAIGKAAAERPREYTGHYSL